MNVFKDNKPYIKILKDLTGPLNDKVLEKTALEMEEKTKIFDKLRVAMRIAVPDGHQGLNDDRDKDIRTIEKRVKTFYNWLYNNDSISKKDGYNKMIAQIEKYWDKLFADPIVVHAQDRIIVIQPQRTNNIIYVNNNKM